MLEKAGPIVIDTSKRRETRETHKWRSGDFQTLVYKNADAMVVLNSDGHILYVNPAAESLFNLSLAELVGVYFGIPIIMDEPVQLQILSEFEDFITVEMRMVDVTWAGQSCYLLSFRDLTDRILAEQAINQSWDRLEDLVEERTRELLDAYERLEREIAGMKHFQAAPDYSTEELASFALSVHNAVCGMPIAIKARHMPGILIEDGEFILSARECQSLEYMFTGNHARQIYIDHGKYMGTNMFASSIVNHKGERTAAIGVIDTKGMLSLEGFVAYQESIEKQLGSKNRWDKHLIRSRR